MFGEIRTMTDERGETFFVGKDIAEALGYAKSRNALAAHVDAEDKKDALIQGPLGGKQKAPPRFGVLLLLAKLSCGSYRKHVERMTPQNADSLTLKEVVNKRCFRL